MIDKILSALQLEPAVIIKKKYGKNPEVSAYKFIEALVTSNNVYEAVPKLGLSRSTLDRAIKEWLPPLEGKTWSVYLKSLAGLKSCSSCKQDKPLDEFSFRAHNKSLQKGGDCRDCRKKYREENKEHLKDLKSKWLDNGGRQLNLDNQRRNKDIVYSRNAQYRANKIGATPPWADHKAIAEFYRNCPVGYEVDHIFPLQGELLCGLHTHDNLQYLTVAANRSKGNKIYPLTHDLKPYIITT